MPSSTRDQIMDAVIAALRGITVTGGYATEIGKVSEQTPPAHPEQIDDQDFPACYPIDANEQQEWMALISATYDIQATLSVIVSCAIFNVEATGLRTARTNLMRDITKALLNDATIRGLCLSVEPDEIITDKGYFENYSTWDQSFKFSYAYDSSVGG